VLTPFLWFASRTQIFGVRLQRGTLERWNCPDGPLRSPAVPQLLAQVSDEKQGQGCSVFAADSASVVVTLLSLLVLTRSPSAASHLALRIAAQAASALQCGGTSPRALSGSLSAAVECLLILSALYRTASSKQGDSKDASGDQAAESEVALLEPLLESLLRFVSVALARLGPHLRAAFSQSHRKSSGKPSASSPAAAAASASGWAEDDGMLARIAAFQRQDATLVASLTGRPLADCRAEMAAAVATTASAPDSAAQQDQGEQGQGQQLRADHVVAIEERVPVLRDCLESLLKFAQSSAAAGKQGTQGKQSQGQSQPWLAERVAGVLSGAFDLFYPTWSARMHRVSLLIGEMQSQVGD
jgi:hypothetical protein